MTLTVLVVDDSKSSRKVNVALARELLGESATMMEAASGLDALAMLRDHTVDIVLLDLTMPGMSGYEVLEEIRKQQLRGNVLVISADIQALSRSRVAALGAKGFIEKPVKLQPLREALVALGVLHV